MRIISKSRLKDFWASHPQAKRPLEEWFFITSKAEWQSLEDLRKIYPSADPVNVNSGSTVTVFNISGNKYRLVTAIHYNTGTVYVLSIMTHAEYSKGSWKANL